MNNRNRFISLMLLLGAVLSFLYYAYKNKSSVDELVASVIINIEMDKLYINDIRVFAEPNERIFLLSPTNFLENDLQNTVVSTEIDNQYIQQLFIQTSQKDGVIESIDNITVFIGNKTYYFPQTVIETWENQQNENGIFFQLPVDTYTKSIIKPWINWYGDLNFALKEIIYFLINPFNFLITLLLLLLVIILAWADITNLLADNKNKKKLIEIFSMVLILFFAFLLRINALTRHSSWSDELYSSTIAANPHLPLINIFKDPGNPPFFYLLLRIWHQIFGWSETSGRMLCVIIGLLGIISLYSFVKMMSGRKCALLAALLLTISSTHIGYSNEIRAYILQMTLVPFVAQRFIMLLWKGSIKNYLLYIILGALIVNTHYFGALFIFANAVYFIVVNRKSILGKNTVQFISANIIIVLSLLPFFIITAFQSAVINNSFNSWVGALGKQDYIAFLFLVIIVCVYPLAKKHLPKINVISMENHNLIDYTICVGSLIYILAFVISLQRNILTWRYLSICIPLLFSILPVLFFNNIEYGKFNTIFRIILIVVMFNIAHSFKMFGGGYNDVYKEAQEYITADSFNNQIKFAELNDRVPAYYNLPKVKLFTNDENYNIVYINPIHQGEKEMLQIAKESGLNLKNILKIKTTNGKYVYKIYNMDY